MEQWGQFNEKIQLMCKEWSHLSVFGIIPTLRKAVACTDSSLASIFPTRMPTIKARAGFREGPAW